MHQILYPSLSHRQLCAYLSLLRQTLAASTLFPAPNVIFLNSRALYHHLAPLPCGAQTIGEILHKIEACIPLAVTEESFALFLSACREQRAERTRSFLESSKADFLLMLRQAAENDQQWTALLALCERLRQKNQRL